MDRSIVYTQEQGRSTDFLFAQRAAMIGLAKLAQACLGTVTCVNGLACTATSPASLSVNIAHGEIYSMGAVDASAYGVLPADTSDTIFKQGIVLGTTNFATPAPTTGGYSINYLIEAIYQDADTTNVVLPYFNSANPSQPLSGQSNSGTAQPTERQGQCVLAVKAGAAATTGSQVTPTPDTGYVGLWVVTVAYGATTVTSSNIAEYANAPFLPTQGVLAALQGDMMNYAVDTGTANAYAVAYASAIPAIADGVKLRFRALHANTGASTFNPNGLGAATIFGAAHTALAGGEIIAGGDIEVVWNSTLSGGTGAWVLLEATGGGLQVAAATQSQHAVQFAQLSGVVGSMRNAKMAVAAASASATFTADEIIVETALGGLQYRLASYSKTINLATTGAGGMDTGTAPVSGFVALYAIYNPVTGTASILATNAATLQGNVYGGANMPAGYTASALIGVWPTNASSQFPTGLQVDRQVGFALKTLLSSSTINTSPVSLSISGSVPVNAKTVSGGMVIANSSNCNMALAIYSDANSTNGQEVGGFVTAENIIDSIFSNLGMTTAQVIYWSSIGATGTPTFSAYVGSYTF